MRVSRERIREKKGKCEGRKSLLEHYGKEKFNKLKKEVIKLRGKGMSYQKATIVLAEQGYLQPTTGKALHKSQLMRL